MSKDKKVSPGRKRQFDTQLRVPMTREMMDTLNAKAQAEGMYMPQIVRRLLTAYLSEPQAGA